MNQIFFSIKFWFSVINQPANEEGFCGWDRTFGIASKFLCHRFSFADYSTGKRIPELFRVDLTTSAALFLSLLLFFFLKVSMNKFTDGDDLWVGCHTLFSARLISVAERTPNAIPDDCKRFRFYFSDGWYSEGGGKGDLSDSAIYEQTATTAERRMATTPTPPVRPRLSTAVNFPRPDLSSASRDTISPGKLAETRNSVQAICVSARGRERETIVKRSLDSINNQRETNTNQFSIVFIRFHLLYVSQAAISSNIVSCVLHRRKCYKNDSNR